MVSFFKFKCCSNYVWIKLEYNEYLYFCAYSRVPVTLRCMGWQDVVRPARLTLSWPVGAENTLQCSSVVVPTPQDSRRCRWLTYSPKSSASCRSRASAPSTDTETARGFSLVSWSYPCCPPRRWNPEGSSPWCHPAPHGMSEEGVRAAVAGCGHRGTSVRKELRTASGPAAALMKPFWSLSSYPREVSFLRNPASRQENTEANKRL